MVWVSKISVRGIFTLKFFLILATSIVAFKEWPPISKNSPIEPMILSLDRHTRRLCVNVGKAERAGLLMRVVARRLLGFSRAAATAAS